MYKGHAKVDVTDLFQHPIGASCAVLTAYLLHLMQRSVCMLVKVTVRHAPTDLLTQQHMCLERADARHAKNHH
jgi:hypothetical protein